MSCKEHWSTLGQALDRVGAPLAVHESGERPLSSARRLTPSRSAKLPRSQHLFRSAGWALTPPAGGGCALIAPACASTDANGGDLRRCYRSGRRRPRRGVVAAAGCGCRRALHLARLAHPGARQRAREDVAGGGAVIAEVAVLQIASPQERAEAVRDGAGQLVPAQAPAQNNKQTKRKNGTDGRAIDGARSHRSVRAGFDAAAAAARCSARVRPPLTGTGGS